MHEVTVLLFGPARDAQRSESVTIHISSLPSTVSCIRQLVESNYPKLAPVMATSIFAVGNKLVSRSKEATELLESLSQEVVLVPPVSGG